VTDPDTWEYTVHGPVRYASLYHGQRYDARLAEALGEWSVPGTDSCAVWKPAAEIPQNADSDMITATMCRLTW